MSGCAPLGSEVEQEPRAEAELSTRVKAKLLDVRALGAAAITVESSAGGKVTLSGFVDNQRRSQQAQRLAEEVDGVAEVVNKLEVKE